MAHSFISLPSTPSSPNLVGTRELKNAIFIPSTQYNKNLSHFASRREFVYGIIASGIVYSTAVENANAAGKRGPPKPPKEKQDPSISGVRAKVLASMKRKEAMKEEVAKLREKGKPVN